MTRPAPYLILLFLLAACLSLATSLQPRASNWSQRGPSASVLQVLLGDGRRIFANHFFVKADIYFHSGYYPSIFDRRQAPKDAHHMTAEEPGHEHQEEEHEKEMDFLGPPRDWFEMFGRHFLVSEHTHLEGGNEREILPWLQLSAELDPQRVETYTVAAYWLRKRLGKVAEAEQFLRQGFRANPGSYEILFELGRLYYENHHDADQARNLWELAARRWREQEPGKKEPDNFALEEITVSLARLEEEQGHWGPAIEWLEQAKKLSPNPDGLQKQIDEARHKLSTQPTSASPSH